MKVRYACGAKDRHGETRSPSYRWRGAVRDATKHFYKATSAQTLDFRNIGLTAKGSKSSKLKVSFHSSNHTSDSAPARQTSSPFRSLSLCFFPSRRAVRNRIIYGCCIAGYRCNSSLPYHDDQTRLRYMSNIACHHQQMQFPGLGLF